MAIVVLTFLAVLGNASPATAAPGETEELGGMGMTFLAAPINGKSALLVPASYPLGQSGRPVRGAVRIKLPGRKAVLRKWTARPHAGTLRLADRRVTFSFVKAVPLGRGLTRILLRNGRKAGISSRLSFSAPAGSPDASVVGMASSTTGIFRARPGLCSTPEIMLLVTGRPARRELPRCGAKVRWSIGDQPESSTAAIKGRAFTLTQGRKPEGADEFSLVARTKGRTVATRKVQMRVAATVGSSVSVRAMGDSVTAGFGYYGQTGKLMPITQLLDCKPAAVSYNDACSSNAYNRNSSVGTTPDYLPDYGLSRNISWAAQWANEYGITDYRNYAVSGSAPSDWLPGGQFDSTRQQIEQQNPDYIVMTMGANPILSDVLFGLDDMGCALEADLFGDYRECVLAAFEAVDLSGKLNALYTQLVQNTTSQILLMQYHVSIPSSAILYSAAQIEMMDSLMNEIISDEASQVSPERINVIAPPRFFVGINMLPQYPANYSCSWFDWKVDGPSVQSTPTQDFLEVDHPLSFCSGPASGQPWVISGDTGIHPSATGYFQMAGQIPAPK